MKPELKPGDFVESGGVVREITEVRPTGYTWRYPEVPDRDFWSENSNDPHFEMGWTRCGKEGRQPA
jgi:hypothetical protein